MQEIRISEHSVPESLVVSALLLVEFNYFNFSNIL